MPFQPFQLNSEVLVDGVSGRQYILRHCTEESRTVHARKEGDSHVEVSRGTYWTIDHRVTYHDKDLPKAREIQLSVFDDDSGQKRTVLGWELKEGQEDTSHIQLPPPVDADAVRPTPDGITVHMNGGPAMLDGKVFAISVPSNAKILR